MGACRSQRIAASFLPGFGVQVWGRGRQIGRSTKPWTHFSQWALPGKGVVQTTQTSEESLQNVRAHRGRTRSDLLPLETWQAARQKFEASPANKLHTFLRQLTPWLLNPIHILYYFPMFVLRVGSAYPPSYFLIPSLSQVLIVLAPKDSYRFHPWSECDKQILISNLPIFLFSLLWLIFMLIMATSFHIFLDTQCCHLVGRFEL